MNFFFWITIGIGLSAYTGNELSDESLAQGCGMQLEATLPISRLALTREIDRILARTGIITDMPGSSPITRRYYPESRLRSSIKEIIDFMEEL
jgi:hypothetical protein